MRKSLIMSALASGLVLGWASFAAADTAASGAAPPAAPIFYCPTPSAAATTTPAPAKTSPAPAHHRMAHIEKAHVRSHPGCPTATRVAMADHHHHHWAHDGRGEGGREEAWRGEDTHAASFANDDVAKSQAFIYRYERIRHGLDARAAHEAWGSEEAGRQQQAFAPPPPPHMGRPDMGPPELGHGEMGDGDMGGPMADAGPPPPDMHSWRDAHDHDSHDLHDGHDMHDGHDGQDQGLRGDEAYAFEEGQHAAWVDDGRHGPPPVAHIERRVEERDAQDGDVRRDEPMHGHVDGHGDLHMDHDGAYAAQGVRIDGHSAEYGYERRDVERDGVDHTSGYAYSDRDGDRHVDRWGDDGHWADDGQARRAPPPCPPPHDVGCTAGQNSSMAYQSDGGPRQEDGYGVAYPVAGRDAQGYLVWPGKTPQ